ncbi:YidB family protein [bacterium]|nr:YidB family protein [bacterium]
MNLMDLAKTAISSLGGQNNTLGMVMQLVEQNGGLSNIMQKFESAGLQNVVQSWIGTGQNLPISAEQIMSVFGNQQVEQIAQKFNLSGSDVAQTVSQFLPQMVDKLTPNGEMSADSMDLGKMLEIGKSFLK